MPDRVWQENRDLAFERRFIMTWLQKRSSVTSPLRYDPRKEHEKFFSDLDKFFKSSVGFDDLFRSVTEMSHTSRDSYPPYNLHQTDSGYIIEMAVAGFGKENIEIYIEGDKLVVEGKIEKIDENEYESERKTLHKGLASRRFTQSFSISPTIHIKGAKVENGILTIDLLKEDEKPPDRTYIEID